MPRAIPRKHFDTSGKSAHYPFIAQFFKNFSLALPNEHFGAMTGQKSRQLSYRLACGE